jgi:hypothetical protein
LFNVPFNHSAANQFAVRVQVGFILENLQRGPGKTKNPASHEAGPLIGKLEDYRLLT